MTLLQTGKSSQTTGDEPQAHLLRPADAADQAERSSAPVNPEAHKAAAILNSIRGLPGNLGIKTATLVESEDARQLFGLSPHMDRQAVIVTLANRVGYRPLQQAYLALTQRQLTVDFREELGSPTISRAGFNLNSADHSRLTNLMLDEGTEDRWIVGNRVVDAVGHSDEFGANLLQGTTRNLARRAVNLPPAVARLLGSASATVARSAGMGATLAVLGGLDGAKLSLLNDPQVIDALIDEVQQARREGHLEGFLKEFQAQRGKSIYAYLGELVRDPGLRQRVLDELPQPISDAQLTYDAFLENIALSVVYADHPGSQLEGEQPGYTDDKRHGHPDKLLHFFGYHASDVYAGKWGFEMRVFTPIPGKAKFKDVIVAFRGTQGISLSMGGNRQGTLDTVAGDFAPQGVGYNQFRHNAAMIDHVIQGVKDQGKLLMTGHSLGGALAQLAAARYPELTRRVVTFQGANIDQADVNRVKAFNRGHTPIQATHYRMDGDVVPTAGEAALPGVIHYFDAAWAMKGQQDIKDVVMNAKPVQRATLGHVMPMLSMYLQGLEVPRDRTGLQQLKKNGIQDEQDVNDLGDASITYAGKYDATRDPAADPRLRLEDGRDNLTGVLASFNLPRLPYRDMYEKELPYNTLLAHLEELTKTAKDYKDFEKKALKLMGLTKKDYLTVSLEVLKLDRELGESLGQQVPVNIDVKEEWLTKVVPKVELLNGEFDQLRRFWGNFR